MQRVLCNLTYQVGTPNRFSFTVLSDLGPRKLANFLYPSMGKLRHYMSSGTGICWKRQLCPDAKQRGKWIQPLTSCHFCFHPYRVWNPLGLEANHSTVKRGRMRDIPGYRWSCTDTWCGQSAEVMPSKIAEKWSHPTFCESPQCDFHSLLLSEHELGRKRVVHDGRWRVKVEHHQRHLNLWPNGNLTLCSASWSSSSSSLITYLVRKIFQE